MQWRARLQALTTGSLARLGYRRGRRMLRKLDADERRILEDARSRVDFETVEIDRGIRGYFICRADSIAIMRDLVDINFRAADEPSLADKAIMLTQRKAWLPLREELEGARYPFVRIPDGGAECYLVSGMYGGEPIDHAYWYWTQRALYFNVAGIACTLREEIGRGPGLATLLAFARQIEEATLRKRRELNPEMAAPSGPEQALRPART
jgi:hypothetical protein